MARIGTRLQAVLEQLGATLKRENKHLVFGMPNGRTFVAAKSASDQRAEANAIHTARKVAGVVVERRQDERRREPRHRVGRCGEAPWRGNGGLAGGIRLVDRRNG